MRFPSTLLTATILFELVQTRVSNSTGTQNIDSLRHLQRLKSIDTSLPNFPVLILEPSHVTDEPTLKHSNYRPLSSAIAEMEVERLLEKVTIQFKDLCPESGFNASIFAQRAPVFRLYLLYATIWADKFRPSEKLSKQLTFAQDAFEAMQKATEALNTYLSSKNAPDIILCRVILLNVRLLALYNRFGEPDKVMEGFTEIIRRLSRVFKFLTEIFQDLEEVLLEVEELFRLLFREVEDRLQYLASPVQKSHYFEKYRERA